MAKLKTRNEITEYLKSQNKPYDYTSRTSLYKQLGLEPKLGSYVGSGQQNTAMINLSNAQKNQITYPSSQISTLPKTGDLGFPKSSAEYDQWIKAGRTFQNGKWTEAGTTGGTTKPTLQTISKGVQDVAGKTQALTQQFKTEGITPSISNKPTEEYVNLDTKDNQTIVDDTMKNIADTIGTTDIATLIGQFSSGELTTPEMEITGEDRQAQLDKLKTDTAGALQKLQQNMAKRGMTFSGIRTQAEADLAADTLSKEAGINRDFAGKIIQAARQEQTRRENALTTAEQNYNKALETGGYYYNPITDKVEKTLEREEFEYKTTQAETTDYPVSYQEWQLAGREQGTGKTFGEWLSSPATEDKPKIAYQNIGNQVMQILTDDYGNILSMNSLGLAPSAATNLQEAFSSHESAITMLEAIGNLADNINWNNNPTLKTVANFLKKIGGKYLTPEYYASLTPGTPEYEYFVSKGTFRSMLTRAAGEKGVLTQRDVENIENALPDVWDTQDSAKKKISNFKKVFNSILEGATRAYKGDITKLNQDSLALVGYVNSLSEPSAKSVDDYLDDYLSSKK